MNEVSRMCTFAKLNPAGAGAGELVRGGVGFFEGVGVGLPRGVGVGVGDADALSDGDDDGGVGLASGFLCEQATSNSPDTQRRATKRAATRGFIDYRTYPLSTPVATGRGAPGPAPGSCRVA